jgi:DNA-binding transcriptional MerR regulator
VTCYSPAEAAQKTGFSLDTLRYYERIGLLPPVGRTAGGRRRYGDTDLLWLMTLRCLRDAGMPLREMRDFISLSRGSDETIPARLALLEAHDQRIEEQMARLRAHQEQIRKKIDSYRSKTAAAAGAAKRARG